MTKTIRPAPLNGTIAAIPSKSCAHRLLICAALAQTPTQIDCPGVSADILATADCLRALGAQITRTAEGFSVTPSALRDTCRLPCGESGSTLRFLLPVAAALGVKADFIMEGRLPERPLAPLDAQLEAHGAHLSRPARDCLRCEGRLLPGDYTLPGNVSSQYISGLLFALPLLERDSFLRVTGKLESAPYVEITRAALRQFGVEIIEEQAQFYRIPASGYRSPGRARVEGDWSNAAFWLCAGALGKRVCVTGLDPDSLQGDKAVFELLQNFGAVCGNEGDTFCVSPGTLHPLDIDASAIPDLVPVLSVVAAAAPGVSRIYNASRLRLKESDRIESVCRMLRALGGEVEETEDGMRIHGGRRFAGGTVDSFGDHRIAMAAAVASLWSDGEVTVTGAEAVQKSYPGFWNDFSRLLAPQTEEE